MADSTVAPLTADEVTRMRALLDRQAIQDCLSRIARGNDRFDKALFLSGFHADGLISAGNATASASDTYDGGTGFHEATTHATLHCLSTSHCELDGDTAHVETYHIYAARNRDEVNWAAAGRYLDRFERRDGIWAIAFRRVVVEWTGKLAPNVIAMFEGAEPANPALEPSRTLSDPSYMRPLRE